MESITSLEVISATIVALLGFVFRLGLEYQAKQKMPKFASILFLFFFSIGGGMLAFLYVIEKEWTATIKLFITCTASFFGSIVITGLGSIKGDFFAELFKDFLRKWLNSKTNDNTNETIQGDEEMHEDAEDGENMG